MFQKYARRFAFVIVILISVLSCALPTGQTPQPLSSDPNMFSTIVAGTANAASTQTASVVTSAPLPASTETAAPASTATPTPRISTEGTSLQKQSDGSYIFTDIQGGYSVVVSPDWLVVRLNEQEFINVWSLPIASNTNIQNFLAQIQKTDPKVFRLYGADIIPEQMQGSFLTNFSIALDKNSTLTLQQEIDQAKKSIPQAIKGAKIEYADMGITSTQIPMGIIEDTWNGKSTSGQAIKIYQKIVAFKVKGGTVAFTLSTTSTLKEAVLKGFDLMTDQIKMLP